MLTISSMRPSHDSALSRRPGRRAYQGGRFHRRSSSWTSWRNRGRSMTGRIIGTIEDRELVHTIHEFPDTSHHPEGPQRPQGSNADEWHMFLCGYVADRAAFPRGLAYVAVQIAEAIEAAVARGDLEEIAKTVESLRLHRHQATKSESDELLRVRKEG